MVTADPANLMPHGIGSNSGRNWNSWLFPSDDPVMGLLNTLLVFGAAFVVRPIGAILFGRLADKKGRRRA